MNYFVYRLLVSLFLIFSVHNTALAKEPSGLVIFAADHSKSMHKGNMLHLVHGLTRALEEYLETCAEIQFMYIPWGPIANTKWTFLLNDTGQRYEFEHDLQHSIMDKKYYGTLHLLAMREAINQVYFTPAEHAIIILVTDETGSSVDLMMPPNTSLIKVSLGGSTVYNYLEYDFMPRVGQTHHAGSARDLSKVIQDAFRRLSVPCVG